MCKRQLAWARGWATLVLLLGITLLPASNRTVSNSKKSRTSVVGTSPLADLPPIVRLRRLHLVRPDLILYPLDYEVDC